MFTKTGVQNVTNPVRDLRHDLILNFSEDYLFNNGTDETSSEVYVEIPYPIHKPFKASTADPVKQFLREKQKYCKTLKEKRRRFKFDKRDIYKEKISNHQYLYLPRHLLEFYKNKDPDVYFNCDYNFYYTSGFLEVLHVNNDDYLVRPDMENNLCLNNLHNHQETVTLNNNIQSRIFGMKEVKSSDGHLIVLRGKYDLNIAKLWSLEESKVVWTYKEQVPMLDSRLNPTHHEQIGIASANLRFDIRNFETGQTVFSYNNEGSLKTDNFQQFQFIDHNVVSLCDRFQVKFIDLRSELVEQILNPDLLECNSLCNLQVVNSNIFLASRHYLIKSDLRDLKNTLYFSHTLNTPPCYMSLATRDEESFMCLATQNEDKVLFSGQSIYSLPHIVPGIKNTFKECCLNHSYMVLRDNLNDRLSFSVAGLKVINLDNEVFIYWSNSLGELFRQKICDHEFNSTNPVEALTDWVNSLEKVDHVLHLTLVEEMSDARFCLNTKPIEKNLNIYKNCDTAQNFLRNFVPIYSKDNVMGTLAQDFLAVWEDDDEDNENEKDEELPEIPVHDKVNSWIQTHDFSDDENSLGFHKSK